MLIPSTNKRRKAAPFRMEGAVHYARDARGSPGTPIKQIQRTGGIRAHTEPFYPVPSNRYSAERPD
jgi:hypothetical protein